MSDWLDISIPLKNGLAPWPGDLAFHREISSVIGEKGAVANVSALAMSSHTGTHMDAPRHFVAEGCGIDEVDPGLLVGPAFVLDLCCVAERHIEAEDLAGRIPEGAVRLLVKTRNSALLGDGVFHEDYTALTIPAIEFAVRSGVRLLGLDYYSIAAYHAPAEAHRALLKVPGTAALENVDLSCAEEGWYDLISLPLKIEGCDGSPARALIRRREGSN